MNSSLVDPFDGFPPLIVLIIVLAARDSNLIPFLQEPHCWKKDIVLEKRNGDNL